MTSVLILGLDPSNIPAIDVDLVSEGLAYGLSRFDGTELVADQCLVALEDSAVRATSDDLRAKRYAVVMIGGGIRKPEALLPFFDALVNLVHRTSPGSLVAFDSNGGDSLDAARRILATSG